MMGLRLSPIIADLFMEDLEERAIASTPTKPKLWLRYVNDTFVIWPHGEDELHLFHQHLNHCAPAFNSPLRWRQIASYCS